MIILLQKLLRIGSCPIMSHYSQNPITYVHIYWRSLRKNHGMLHFKCADSESCSSRKWTKVSLQNGAAEENVHTPARTLSISGLNYWVFKLSFSSLKRMVKSGLEFILKFTEPLQRYLLSCQANFANLGRYFCTGQKQLWSDLVNFKIKSLDHFLP